MHVCSQLPSSSAPSPTSGILAGFAAGGGGPAATGEPPHLSMTSTFLVPAVGQYLLHSVAFAAAQQQR